MSKYHTKITREEYNAWQRVNKKYDLVNQFERLAASNIWFIILVPFFTSGLFFGLVSAFNMEVTRTIGDYTYKIENPGTFKFAYWFVYCFLLLVVYGVNVLVKSGFGAIGAKVQDGIRFSEVATTDRKIREGREIVEE